VTESPNEPVEKVTFLKTASSAGSKIRNYFLSSKVLAIFSATLLNLKGSGLAIIHFHIRSTHFIARLIVA
jgi:hypothetical protein